MHNNSKFLTFATVMGFMLLLIANNAMASMAAKVDFASGNPTISNTSGQFRPAIKGVEMDSGEMIETHEGIVQLRFTDGGKLSLQPDTTFRIDDYSFNGTQDGSERNFTTLLKGGLRTITGLIGKKHKDSYKLGTTVASIGIRGTEFIVKFNGVLEVHVIEGEVAIQNSAGTIALTKGHSARVTSESNSPQQTDMPPQMAVKAQEIPFNYMASEDQTRSGTQSIMSVPINPNQPTTWTISGNAPPLPIGQVYTIAHSLGMTYGASAAQSSMYEIHTFNNVSITNDTTGLAAFCLSGSACSFTATISGGLAAYADSNADGIPDKLDVNMTRTFASYDNGAIGLGSWIGGTMWASGWKNMPLGGYHYVIGIPTATMPTNGTATYSLLGATATTYSHGNNLLGAGSLTSASMTVDFGSNKVNGYLGFSFTGGNYSSNFTGSVYSSTFTANGSTLTNGTSIDICGTMGCRTQVNGLFAGTSARNAGLVYLIQSNQTFVINGAAVLQKSQ